MAEEDKKDPKGLLFESSKQQVLEFLQEVLSDPEGAAELEFPLRIPKRAEEEAPKPQGEDLPKPPQKQETKAGSLQKPLAPSYGPSIERRARSRHPSFSLAKAIRSIFINGSLFAATFLTLHLVTGIPGSTKFNRLHFNSEIGIDLLLLPLWVNIGCAIGSFAVLFGLTVNNQRCRLGLVIGIPAGLMALISNSVEGYIEHGILFGFGAGILCVILILICFVKNMDLGDVLRIACVAFLSVLAIVGPALHFLAALIIGLPIALVTQVVLSTCILISK